MDNKDGKVQNYIKKIGKFNTTVLGIGLLGSTAHFDEIVRQGHLVNRKCILPIFNRLNHLYLVVSRNQELNLPVY